MNGKLFRIEGVLDFSLIGILSKISTYNTDYILIKEANFDKSLILLQRNGYLIKKMN